MNAGPRAGWRQAFVQHGPQLMATALFVIAGTTAQAYFAPQYPYQLTLWIYPGVLLAFTLGSILAVSFYVVVLVTPRRPLPLLRAELRTLYSHERLINALPVILLTGFFFGMFSRMKSLIGILHPFAWDSVFAQADRWLAAGHAPWRLLAPVFLNGPAVSVLTAFYDYLWHVLCYAMLAAITLQSMSHRRMRFLWAFFGCWSLIGVCAAVALSSAGPVFYHHITGDPGYFAAQVARIRQLADSGNWLTPQPLFDLLWQAHLMPGGPPPGLGISAMPSMHVAMSCLFLLYANAYGNLRAKVLAALVLAMTLVGSVVLGWHYAIDGYVAILMTLCIWWLADRLARTDMWRWERLSKQA